MIAFAKHITHYGSWSIYLKFFCEICDFGGFFLLNMKIIHFLEKKYFKVYSFESTWHIWTKLS